MYSRLESGSAACHVEVEAAHDLLIFRAEVVLSGDPGGEARRWVGIHARRPIAYGNPATK